MHATIWLDAKRRAWLTLYADGTRTWQSGIGSMPLAADHEIPGTIPTAARVVVDGSVGLGEQPTVTFDGLRFTTSGPLAHPADEPTFGVGPTLPLSGRFRLRPGVVLDDFMLPFAAGQVLLALLGPRATYPLLAVSGASTAWWLARRVITRRRERAISRSATCERLRAVTWQAAPRPHDRTLKLMLSLYALDAASGSTPIGTVRLKTEPDPPIPYAAQVVVRGEPSAGALIVIEHDGRSLPASALRTDISPQRPYDPADAATQRSTVREPPG